MDNESIKIEIQNQDENSDMADLNKNNVKGGNDMENENKTVLNDYNDKRLENIGIEEEMDLFFILDRSGSMSGSESDTINGFNAFIEKQAVKNHNIRVTTILFDDKYQVLYSRKPISEVKALTEKEYYVRGCTALLDSIGKTVNSYKNEVGSAMCIITSDGYENASREYDRDQIRNIIENCGWEFVFIGADIDSYTEASRIGIRKSRVANYNKTAKGHEDMYEACNLITDRYYRKRDINDNNVDWKEKLD
ncbi:MAG: VWA domain-containing protein [Methanobrevibacter sp.]|nr:VWA domain-containing protein [Methanobrevibacter sp.]